MVTSLYSELPDASKLERFSECLQFRDATAEVLANSGVDLTQADSLGRLAVAYSDGVIEGETGAQSALLDYARSLNIPVLNAPAEDVKAATYKSFFEQL